MQKGPAGGLAGEVPRTVTSHILRNLTPTAEILMALGHTSVCVCVRERENVFPCRSSTSHIPCCKYLLSATRHTRGGFRSCLQRCLKADLILAASTPRQVSLEVIVDARSSPLERHKVAETL